jgi:hypothetical protein
LPSIPSQGYDAEPIRQWALGTIIEEFAAAARAGFGGVACRCGALEISDRTAAPACRGDERNKFGRVRCRTSFLFRSLPEEGRTAWRRIHGTALLIFFQRLTWPYQAALMQLSHA